MQHLKKAVKTAESHSETIRPAIDNLPELPNTDRILAGMCDMRIPLTFDLGDCEKIAQIIADVADQILPREDA